MGSTEGCQAIIFLVDDFAFFAFFVFLCFVSFALLASLLSLPNVLFNAHICL